MFFTIENPPRAVILRNIPLTWYLHISFLLIFIIILFSKISRKIPIYRRKCVEFRVWANVILRKQYRFYNFAIKIFKQIVISFTSLRKLIRIQKNQIVSFMTFLVRSFPIIFTTAKFLTANSFPIAPEMAARVPRARPGRAPFAFPASFTFVLNYCSWRVPLLKWQASASDPCNCDLLHARCLSESIF